MALYIVYLTVQTDEEGSSRIQRMIKTDIQPNAKMKIPATEESDIILQNAISVRGDLVTNTISLIYIRDADTIVKLLEAGDWEMAMGKADRV